MEKLVFGILLGIPIGVGAILFVELFIAWILFIKDHRKISNEGDLNNK